MFISITCNAADAHIYIHPHTHCCSVHADSLFNKLNMSTMHLKTQNPALLEGIDSLFPADFPCKEETRKVLPQRTKLKLFYAMWCKNLISIFFIVIFKLRVLYSADSSSSSQPFAKKIVAFIGMDLALTTMCLTFKYTAFTHLHNPRTKRKLCPSCFPLKTLFNTPW